MDDVMTTKEAAEILEIAPESVARLVRQGTLRGERFGRSWMIYRSSVEEYLEQNKDKAKSEPTRGKTKD